MEQVAHAVDEDHLRSLPAEGLGQFLGDEAWVESLLIGMALHPAKALGERLGIAMIAAGRDLRATPYRVPCRVGPFDMGVFAHEYRPLPYPASHVSAACPRSFGKPPGPAEVGHRAEHIRLLSSRPKWKWSCLWCHAQSRCR